MNFKADILDSQAVVRTVTRISHEIIEKVHGINDLCLIGVRTRGVPFAEMIQKNLKDIDGKDVPMGILDITLYRDDLHALCEHPIVNKTEIPFSVANKTIVLVDDVLYTGRTVRAAIDAIIGMGRPKAILLAVLIDRGHRELPIRADFVGKNLPTAKNEVVVVSFCSTDGADSVKLYSL